MMDGVSKLRTGIDMSSTGFSNDINYVAGTGGTAMSLPPSASYDTDGLAQFECKVYSEAQTEGDPRWFLKTRKGVCNFSWTQFPFKGAGELIYSGSGTGDFDSVERQKQVIVKDWAIYKTGTRTAGTTTTSDWMANDGKIELKNAANGGSDNWLVTISKIDWWDRDGWHEGRRIIEAEVPFVSVFDSDDTGMQSRILTQWDNSLWENIYNIWTYETGIGTGVWATGMNQDFAPRRIGYCYKKIAKITWDNVKKEFVLTQYITGTIDLPIMYHCKTKIDRIEAGTQNYIYDNGVTNQFNTTIESTNYSWFESMWAPATGYTFNPSDWSQLLVDE